MVTRRNLCKIKGLSENKVDKIKEVASKIVVILRCAHLAIGVLSIT